MDAHLAEQPRLLVVDDDEVMRDLLLLLLGESGYQVTLCSSGEQAVDLLQGGLKPSIILTDLQMAGIEGIELVLALRAAATSAPVVLGMSAGRPSSALLTHLDAFLSKPFGMTQFKDALESARETLHLTSIAPTTSVAAEQPASGAIPSLPPSSKEGEVTPTVLDDTIVSALSRTLQPGQLRELYLLTLTDVTRRFERIENSAAAGDLPAVHREAHAIKGSCGMVGARELQALATVLETGTTLNTSALRVFPAACDRLRRMLDEKLQLS